MSVYSRGYAHSADPFQPEGGRRRGGKGDGTGGRRSPTDPLRGCHLDWARTCPVLNWASLILCSSSPLDSGLSVYVSPLDSGLSLSLCLPPGFGPVS